MCSAKRTVLKPPYAANMETFCKMIKAHPSEQGTFWKGSLRVLPVTYLKFSDFLNVRTNTLFLHCPWSVSLSGNGFVGCSCNISFQNFMSFLVSECLEH